MRISLIILLFFSFLLTHCTLKKRAYRSGYYISWNSKKHKASSKTENETQATVRTTTINPEPITNVAGQLTAEESKVLIPQSNEKPKLTVLSNKDECGDIITFRKGNEVKAKVIEINETQIKYKRCDHPDGPLMVVNKNDVFSIKYVNGLVEHFDRTVDYTPTLSNKKSKGQEVHPLAYVTLGLTIGILFLSLVALAAALIVGIIARRKILEQPERYRGLEMVNVCMIVCLVLLALFVLFVAVLLTTFGI